MAKFVKVEEKKVVVSGNCKMATLSDGEREFSTLQPVIKIGDQFYKRCKVSDLSGPEMAYADVLTVGE